MKKLLACMLAGTLAICLGACGSSKEETASTEAVIAANEALESMENAAADGALESAEETAADEALESAEETAADEDLESAEETAADEALESAEDTAADEALESMEETAADETLESMEDAAAADEVNEGAVLAGGSAGSNVILGTQGGEDADIIADAEGAADAADGEDVAAAGDAADDDEIRITDEGEISTDKIMLGDASEEEAEEETARIEAEEAVDLPDVSQAVDGSATSETEPAPFGAWVKTALYATQDSTYHTAYVRIAKVTTESDDPVYVETAIEANNGYGDESDRIDPEEMDIQDDAEIVVMDYEVFVPVDFPSPSYGITEPKVYFSMRNIGGGGIPSLDGSTAYIGMGSTDDMVVRAPGETYTPGHTYGERCIYMMVKGYTGYVASYSSYPDGTSSDETSSEIMYTVYHSIN